MADPDRVTRYLSRLQSAQPEAFQELSENPSTKPLLLAVFGYSNFLSEEIIQHPDWLRQLGNAQDLYRALSSEEYMERLEEYLGPDTGAPAALSLAVFRRRELLRILIRDVLAYGTLSEITQEMSSLADSILDVTYRRIRSDLVKRYGTPRFVDIDDVSKECEFSVIALGKLGGEELNYSSDIDLMFIYSGSGTTDGPYPITNKEFFKKVANQYIDLLSTYTAEGMCYRVDLRLRPDGRLGEICLSLEGMKAYYEKRARDWELQMLIKARVAAGEKGPGKEFLDFVEPRIYVSTLDFSAVESVSLTRERIHEKLASRQAQKGGGSELDVKLARGGIRDIEFLVQCLQRLHGGREPWVRHGGTLLALRRLRDKDFLSDPEYSKLASAYQFLRDLEHRLQFMDDRQTHTLPTHREDLDLLSKRMPKGELGRAASADSLLHELNLHLEEVQETYDRVIHSQQPLYYTPVPSSSSVPVKVSTPDLAPKEGATNLIRVLDQRAPQLAAVIASSALRRGFKYFEHFLEKVIANGDRLHQLDTNEVLARDIIDLFENSPHFSEELMRNPELLDQLASIREEAAEPVLWQQDVEDPAELRRVFRRSMLRIQARSICLGVPIFTTLQETSDLADLAINSAYNLAIRQVLASHPPIRADYLPSDQMMVIAMGRLGMREFDLGSDADLNFVIADADAGELRFWTRVAERLIDLLSAYTGEGTVFAVDTRLRPNGREGTLVQAVGIYKEYLLNRAEAWEGITYMKSRALAGNAENATRFLHELQEVDWRRYGQSGRSRTDLRAMRARLEREQGEQNPLKAGAGGYYDIDFALMYLRLKSAGIFFKVLNTPERIDVIEKMGHLDREDASFLQDAATFYRALDHGLRVYSGHAEGRLPGSETHLATLSKLVRRWTPERLHDLPLPEKLAQIQRGTREYFRRLFG